MVRKDINISLICNTKEEAMQCIQEEMNKAEIMQDTAFDGGCEKQSSQQKQALNPNPKDENADEDSNVLSPINLRGNYGECNNESRLRPEECSNNIKVDKEDEIMAHCNPEGCDKNSKKYGKRTNVIWTV